MFAGFDNLDTSNAAFVGDLRRVKPEQVRDLEAGTVFRSSMIDVQADAYAMQFHDEITPIGTLSYIGTPLRKNVGFELPARRRSGRDRARHSVHPAVRQRHAEPQSHS
jgi:hypothetical protein